LPKPFEVAPENGVVRAGIEDTQTVDLPRLLRLGAERRGDGTGQRGQQEAAAVHAGDGRAEEDEGQLTD
jgi:hypothetical protein